jgi:hypothetical protein
MSMRTTTLATGGLAALVLAVAPGCGGDDSCDPVARTGCDDGLVCEVVEGGEPACFAPLVVRGRVFNLADDAAIEGARVVGLDPNGAPLGAVAESGTDGRYELEMPRARNAEGVPVAGELTLRGDAEGFQTFPSGIRQALPVDISTATKQGDAWVVEAPLTDIGLIALPAGAGTASLSGTVDLPDGVAGVLVVAETTSGQGVQGYAAPADLDGHYTLYNLPAATYSVTAYAVGARWAVVESTLADGQDGTADIGVADGALGGVSGSVSIVNAPGGSQTSVLLVVESTFDETLKRGASPPGMRVGAVSGAYTLENVPPGKYVVLAAFENDDLVRDPDTEIGGTAIAHIQVAEGMTTAVDGFKVTEALAVISPGAEDPEGVPMTGLTFVWADDSSEDEYQIRLFDSFGQMIWEKSIPGVSGSANAEVAYDGPALTTGMYYQFRATSIRKPMGGTGTPISTTEDLRGCFWIE